MKRGVYFQRYWRHHYFDWTLFLKRSMIYGVAGGVVAGTFLFGDAQLALNRIVNKYNVYLRANTKEVGDAESKYNIYI